MINERARESRVRRRLSRDGQRLWIPRGRYEWEYGPYAVIDESTNAAVAYGCTLDGLEADLQVALPQTAKGPDPAA